MFTCAQDDQELLNLNCKKIAFQMTAVALVCFINKWDVLSVVRRHQEARGLGKHSYLFLEATLHAVEHWLDHVTSFLQLIVSREECKEFQ